MKSARQRKGKTVEASKNHKDRAGYAGVKKSTSRSGGWHQKAPDMELQGVSHVVPLSDTSVNSFLGAGKYILAHVDSGVLANGCKSFRGTTNEVPALESKTGQLHSSAKIKMQLFPIDESIRIGLEKDGHNPFLELTLSPRKKICSVLKHLNAKWGSSSVARGEIVLFPFNTRMENLATERRWTSNDSGIRAGDVYINLGSPVIFRLRYAWCFHFQPKTFGVPSSVPQEASFNFGGIQKGGCSVSHNTNDQMESVEVSTEEFREPNNIKKAEDVEVTEQEDEVKIDDGPLSSSVPWDNSFTNLSIGGLLSEASLQEKISDCDIKSESKSGLQPIQLISDISVGALLSEASLQGKINNFDFSTNGSKLGLHPITEKAFAQLQSPWDDSITTLSMGGLLSEASLQEKINNYDAKTNGSKSGFHPTLSVSDSFDAFIASQISSHPQMSKPLLSHDTHSSILDAEETCHAFSFRKFSSSVKDAVAGIGRASSGVRFDDMSLKSFRFPNIAEVNDQAGLAQPPHQESKKNLLPHSRPTNNEDSSLGLTGIIGNDSMGPFDPGLSSSQQVNIGESISISQFIP